MTRNMDELTREIIMWRREKHIDNYQLQVCKVVEELGELCSELTRGRTNGPAVIDALGDTLVTVLILADILGYTPKDCLTVAYNEIKNRKGVTINGSFVKADN